LVGGGEAVDVHDLGDQGGGRGRANAGDGEDLNVGRGGQLGERGGQQLPEVFLGFLAVTDLGHEVADQHLGQGAAECCHRLPCGLVQRLGSLGGQIGDLLQRSAVGPGDAFGGGILVQQPQHPAGGQVVGQRGEFREGARQEVVQPVDGLSRLPDLGLQAASDLAQQDQRRRGRWRGVGLFDDGEAGHGLALGVVGGPLGEVGLLIVPIALGLADGDRHGPIEAAEELFEIDGVLAGGIDTDVEVGLGMSVMQLLQAFLQGLIAGTVLLHSERLSGRSSVGPEEGDPMTVARGIDTDANAVEHTDGAHRRPSKRRWNHRLRHVSERIGVSLPRGTWARRSL
jgi:hypothetical protein